MNLLDIFEGREPHQQAIDRLEQRRIEDLEARMDDCARRGDKEGFQKCKAERDSYYKVNEAGIGQDIADKAEKIARATPPTPAGKVASTVKNAAKWLAGKGGPGKEGPTYEEEELDEKLKGLPTKKLGTARDVGKSVKKFRAQRGLEEAGTDSQWSQEGDWKAVPKAKSGRPVDPRGEVAHMSDVARRQSEMSFPEPRKATPDELRGRHSKQFVVKDGIIYHFQDPRGQKKSSKQTSIAENDQFDDGPYTLFTHIVNKGQPLNMDRAKVAKFVKNEVMQQRTGGWAALVNNEGKVIWRHNPNGQLPERFRGKTDIKPPIANYYDTTGAIQPGSPEMTRAMGSDRGQNSSTYFNQDTAQDWRDWADEKEARKKANSKEVEEGSWGGSGPAGLKTPYAVYTKQNGQVKRVKTTNKIGQPMNTREAEAYVAAMRKRDPARWTHDTVWVAPADIDLDEEQKSANPNEFRPVGPITIMPPKKLKSGETYQGINDYWKAQGQAPIYKTNESGDRVDPILIKALNNMPDGLSSHGEVLNACYDAYAMELGKMEMKSQYGTTRAYIPQLMDLYKQKHGLTFNEATNPAQQAAIAIAMKKAHKKPKTDEAQDWQGNYGAGQAKTTDHTMDEAIEYVKGNYPYAKKYRVRRAEPGFRANQDSGEFNRSHAHVTDVDSAMDYLQLKENPVMSGSRQPTPSLGYSWHTNENRGSGIAVFYYEDRGMGWDEIIVAAKDKKNLAAATQVFRDAGVIPELKKKGVAEGIVDTIRSKNYARLADRSADKRATALDNFDEPEHQKQTDIMKQRNLKSRLLNKKGVAEGTDQVKKVFKDKSGKPVGEIGIDPESSPGNGEWYVYHYATGYSVVGFDSAAEAKRELMYVHKHPDAVEGHESTLDEQGVAEDVGGWIVFDPETKQIKKRFKTHTAGKSYAKTHGLGFASSEHYFDRIKDVAEDLGDTGVLDNTDIANIQHPNSFDWQATRGQHADAIAKNAPVADVNALKTQMNTLSGGQNDAWEKTYQKYQTQQAADNAAGYNQNVRYTNEQEREAPLIDPMQDPFQGLPDSVMAQSTLKQTNNKYDYKDRTSSVQGPNPQGEYQVTVTQFPRDQTGIASDMDEPSNVKGSGLASHYITKNPPQNWMVKERNDVEEEKVRLDPKCWKGKKIGNPKTKMKGGVRVNNCVPAEESYMESVKQSGITDAKLLEAAAKIDRLAKSFE